MMRNILLIVGIIVSLFVIILSLTKVENFESKEEPSKCANKSLTELHSTGKETPIPYQTMCKMPQYNEDDDERVYRERIKQSAVPIDIKIIASNSNEFDGHQEPLKLDMPLFNKDEPANSPVGVNYAW